MGRITKGEPQIQQDSIQILCLVFSDKPFWGSWIQAIGAFLSRVAAPNNVLQKCIQLNLRCCLFENSGFQLSKYII